MHLGGLERLLDELREHLARTGRAADPYQLARVGQAAMAAETAHLWLERACLLAEDAATDPDMVVAYVNLARLAVERAALDVLEHTHRSIGLAGFLRTHPVERLSRDLTTYLRQPAPDRALAQAASLRAGFGRPCGRALGRSMILAADYLRSGAGVARDRARAQLTGGRGVVVVAPHPDDESLGCGGLIAACCAHGIEVRLVVLSDGTGSHPNSQRYPAARLRDLREAELRQATSILGLPEHAIACLRLRDRAVPERGPRIRPGRRCRCRRPSSHRRRQRVRDLAA